MPCASVAKSPNSSECPRKASKYLGPAAAPVPRLKNEFRYQTLVKSTSRPLLSQILHRLRQHSVEAKWPVTALVIDVDPLSLL